MRELSELPFDWIRNDKIKLTANKFNPLKGYKNLS